MYNLDHKHKVTLVVREFHQIAGLDYHDTFSILIKGVTIQIIFNLTVTYNQDIQQLDVNNAFFNSGLEEMVYIEQPPCFKNSKKEPMSAS